ncbi:MAG: type III secretion system chaperone [Pseudomonadota bacterium]
MALPAEPWAALLGCLLSLGHLGLETGGGSISIDEAGEKAVLWLGWPVAGLDPERLELLMMVFLGPR